MDAQPAIDLTSPEVSLSKLVDAAVFSFSQEARTLGSRFQGLPRGQHAAKVEIANQLFDLAAKQSHNEARPGIGARVGYRMDECGG
jgi:hypothetical protein